MIRSPRDAGRMGSFEKIDSVEDELVSDADDTCRLWLTIARVQNNTTLYLVAFFGLADKAQ